MFRSRDGGKSSKGARPNADTGAIDLPQPGDPNVIYAALARAPPTLDLSPSDGPGNGLYKSTDGGEHWTQIRAHGFPEHVGRVGLAISAAAAQRVYALVDGDEGGLYRSDDAGATWTRKNSDARIWQRDWYFGEIAADPKNADRIYVPNTIVLRSDNGGTSFDALKGDQTGDDFHAMWIDPRNPQRQMLGVDQGASSSERRQDLEFVAQQADGADLSHQHRQPFPVLGLRRAAGLGCDRPAESQPRP